MRSPLATTTPAIISLGSNLGDRRRYLREAVRRLGREMRVVRVSSIYETSGVDTPTGSPPFLNAVALVLTSATPGELLRQLQRIENDLGRRRSIRNGPRTLDLAGTHGPRGIAGQQAAAQIGAAGDGGQVYVCLDRVIHEPEPVG